MQKTKSVLIILIIGSMFFAGCAGNNGSTTQKTSTTLPATTPGINPYNMSMDRILPIEANAGTTFTVKLVLAINGTEKPGLLGVTEDYPSNWKVTNIAGGGVLREKRSAIEWLFFPPFGPAVQNTTLTYQLTPPEGTTGTYFFEGNLTFGTDQDYAITGQDNITIN